MTTTALSRDCLSLASQLGSCTDVPCAIPASCRPAYYAGKLLTEHDFCLEQQYHIDKHRLHNLALHGWGVVSGLKVIPHQNCPNLRITLEPGLALDHCGREIRLLEPIDAVLPAAPPPSKPPDPCPPDVAPEPPPPEQLGRLWVCIRYCEQQTELALAPFDECNCGGAPMRPGRVCESFCVDFHDKEPDCFKKHHEDCRECKDIYKEGLRETTSPKCCCVPLAIIHRYAPGKKVDEAMIEDVRLHFSIPSVRTLDRLVRCILDKLPSRKLTRIDDINWTHGEQMDGRQLHERFIRGPNGEGEGFVITFDGPVHHRGVNERTFQAMIVFHSGPRSHQVQIAPARVELKDHRRCHLHIDPHYAHELHGHDFDLFISLKCDVVLDERGMAVDGNLLARLGEDGSYYVDAPTGDGVPGGLFQSWIRILHNKSGD